MDIQENDDMFALERKETVLTVDGFAPVTWKHEHDDTIPDEEEDGSVFVHVRAVNGAITLSSEEAEGLVQALQKAIEVASGESRVINFGGFVGEVEEEKVD